MGDPNDQSMAEMIENNVANRIKRKSAALKSKKGVFGGPKD